MVSVYFRPTVTCKKSELSLAQLLLDRRLKVVAVPGDGLCLLHAVRTVLNNDERFDTTTADIAEKVWSEVRRNLSHYKPFFQTSCSSSTILKNLNAYFDAGKYDTDVGDIAIPALCNALELHIIIFEEHQENKMPCYVTS